MQCTRTKSDREHHLAEKLCAEVTNKTVNAFQILMSGGRAYPKPKFTRDILVDFPRDEAEQEGRILYKFCNTLWYLTNQHMTINDAAQRNKDVFPVPSVFDSYQGYNDLKRKKIKSQPLDCPGLESHSQALNSLLMKPVVNSSSWQFGYNLIKELADCLDAYRLFLQIKNEDMKEKQKLLHPPHTVDMHATVEYKHPCSSSSVKDRYTLIDTAVKLANKSPVYFDESVHIKNPFLYNKERFDFFKNIQLSVPVDMVRFCPGGSCVSSVCLVEVAADRTESSAVTDGARFVQMVRHKLVEYHTRQQRRQFKLKLSNVVDLSGSIGNFIYKELAMDGSAASNPITHQRLERMAMGEPGLVADMRHLNPGRPSGTYDKFFEVMLNFVESITAGDYRRHGTAHVSQFISLRDMIKKTTELCPPGTSIPSKSLVRLQFVPRNPYTHAALSFTSKIPVQNKIQRRQLRVNHVDAHFCQAQLNYLKHRAVELTSSKCVMFCADDKAKVPVGSPECAVSTGVRGKKSLAPSNTTLVALDHDMSCCSLTSSVLLKCRIPKDPVTLNDSIFQSASPFRHTSMLTKVLNISGAPPPPIIMKFTDGGTDQPNTLESVRCADICLFKEFNADMVIHLRCAPGHSWTNPAERVMSILNLGLQNISLEREKGTDELERKLKSCNCMADIRAKPELREEWQQLIGPTQRLIQNRFRHLALKEEPITIIDPISDIDVDIGKRQLKEMFPGLNIDKLQKTFTKRHDGYQCWLQKHCKMTQYAFQIRKCEDEDCCPKPALSRDDLRWLPDPILDDVIREDTGEIHSKRYDDVKDSETTECDRPSLNMSTRSRKVRTETKYPDVNEPGTSNNQFSDESNPCLLIMPQLDNKHCKSQNARGIIKCIDCDKPRVIYSCHKLTERQEVSLSGAMSEYEYSCGSVLLPPSSSLCHKVMCRTDYTCETPVQLTYYASGLGSWDPCCFCAAEDGEVDLKLKKKFKTVLPVCTTCLNLGKVPVVQRPFGKATNKD